jgi:hypothetical protein
MFNQYDIQYKSETCSDLSSGLYRAFKMAYHGLSQHVNFEELPAPGDRFILQDLIGEGTYGEVYSARDTVTGKKSSHVSHALIMSKFTPEIAGISYNISSRQPRIPQWPRGLT